MNFGGDCLLGVGDQQTIITTLAFLSQIRHERRFRVIRLFESLGKPKKAGGACLHGAASAIGNMKEMKHAAL